MKGNMKTPYQGNSWGKGTPCCGNGNVETNRPGYNHFQEQKVYGERERNTYMPEI